MSEKIADIVAQMRGRGEDGRMDMWLWRQYADRIEEAWKREKAEIEADALAVGGIVEAARRREATAEKSSAVGNVAACKKRDEVVLRLSKDEYRGMQEALSEHDCLCEMLSEFRMSVGNAAAMREALVAVKKSIDGIGESSLDCDPTILMASLTQVCARLSARIERALSAPARNCDLYASATEALKAQDVAFNEDNFKNGECKLGCPGCDDGLIDCKILWLFATAKERKGPGK